MMADVRFLYNLQHFPKDNINAETIDLMQPYLNYHLYTYEAALQACGNVAGLIQWTISMVTFYGINKDVLPLKVLFILIIKSIEFILVQILPVFTKIFEFRQIWQCKRVNMKKQIEI